MIYYLIIGIVFFGQLFPPVVSSVEEKLVSSFDQNENVILDVVENTTVSDFSPIKISDSSGIHLTAQSALVIDKKTGEILFQKEPDSQRSIASITKIMTALVFLDYNPGFEDAGKIGVGENSLEGSRIQVKSDDLMTIRDLFYASLVGSANNATQALVHSTGLTGEEFVIEMNKKAKSIGMSNTHYVEPTGLSSKNISTVTDLAKLAKVAFSNEEIKDATTRKEHSFITIGKKEYYQQITTNDLLDSYLNITGAKTGFTYDAGYCMVMQTENEQGKEIITVVLDSDSSNSRFQETKALITWAYDNFQWK